MAKRPVWALAATSLALLIGALGCTIESIDKAADSGGAANGSGASAAGSLEVRIDGSSTVYPITEAVAEEFQKVNAKARVTVGVSGTGGGMKKFSAGETDISNASRGIKPAEAEKCEAAGIEFIELSVAFDGLAIMLNPGNDWCDSMTVEQLKELWRPESPIKKWSDLNPEWPDEEIHLYCPGADSGTFDYFTEVIVGEEKASRNDFTASEDDNVLVTGIASDKYAMGYFGFAYYVENADTLKLMGVDSGEGPQTPSLETVRSNTYKPLSRPLFIYVSKPALKRPVVSEFIDFYLEKAAELATEVGYVPVSDEVADENQAKLEAAKS
ncbi:MAG: PstS family phosphate ABC transporter substrate-binding protein [Planctomycetota bacterium]